MSKCFLKSLPFSDLPILPWRTVSVHRFKRHCLSPAARLLLILLQSYYLLLYEPQIQAGVHNTYQGLQVVQVCSMRLKTSCCDCVLFDDSQLLQVTYNGMTFCFPVDISVSRIKNVLTRLESILFFKHSSYRTSYNNSRYFLWLKGQLFTDLFIYLLIYYLCNSDH